MRTLFLVSVALLTTIMGSSFHYPATAQTITEYPLAATNQRPRGITVGPDGNMWFVGNNRVGFVTPAGIVKEFAIPNAPNYDTRYAVFRRITGGSDGNLWFTGENTISRVTPQGVVTDFLLPNQNSDFDPGRTVYAFPKGITLGADGNIWFTILGRAKVGRITPAGVITEFVVPGSSGTVGIATAPDGSVWYTSLSGHIGKITPTGVVTTFALPVSLHETYDIAADIEGNLWFTAQSLADTVGGTGRVGDASRIVRMTPQGVFSQFKTATPSAGVSGIALGPDGNMWFTEATAGKIGRITPSGQVTEYPLPIRVHDGFISQIGLPILGVDAITAGPDGAMWFAEGQQGNKVGRITVPAVDVRVGPVFSSLMPTRSFLRFHNTDKIANTVDVEIINADTGTALGIWSSPSIPAGAELEFDIATLEDGANKKFPKSYFYTLRVASKFSGYFRHLLNRTSDGVITNFSVCAPGTLSPRKELAGVPSSLSSGSTSAVIVHNTGFGSKRVRLGVYDARDGGKIGVYDAGFVPSHGQATISVSALEGAVGAPTAGVSRYVIKAETQFAGYLQHVLSNRSAGPISDMTTACQLQPGQTTEGIDIIEYPTGPNLIPSVISASSSGAIWFAGRYSQKIARISEEGVITEYPPPGAPCCVHSLAKGPNGSIWVGKSDGVGRLNADGSVAEFSKMDTPTPLTDIAAGADGLLWFTAQMSNEIIRRNVDGSFQRFTLPRPNSRPKNIVLGHDGNLWFTQDSPGGRLSYITMDGVIKETDAAGSSGLVAASDGSMWALGVHSSPVLTSVSRIGNIRQMRIESANGSLAEGIDGNLWFTQYEPGQIVRYSGSRGLATFKMSERARADGIASTSSGDLWIATGGVNAITRMTLTLPGLQMNGVFSTQQTASRSSLRFYNSGASAQRATVILTDSTTGASLGQWTSSHIPASGAAQFDIAEIQAGAAIPYVPAQFDLTINQPFDGYVQHLVWRPADGTISNLTACDAGTVTMPRELFSVHSSLFDSYYPALISTVNTGIRSASVSIGLYDAANGAKLGVYTSPKIAPRGSTLTPISTMELAAHIQSPPPYYVVKVEGAFSGYLQHVLFNVKPGLSADMTSACSLK